VIRGALPRRLNDFGAHMAGAVSTFWRRLTGRGGAPAIGRKLAEEQTTEFFRWFHLAPSEDPSRPANGGAWQSFRPSGPAFHSLVRLDLLVDGNEVVIATQLRLDRRFVEGPRNSASARDIAKSFLIWALRKEPAAHAHPLIANIADMRQAAEPVIMHADAIPPPPPGYPTGGYAVYLGRQESAATTVGRTRIMLSNVAEADGTRWLVLDVAPT
jgi:hypothetical protein